MKVKQGFKAELHHKVELLWLFAPEADEHGPRAVLPGLDGQSHYVVAGTFANLPRHVIRARCFLC